MVKKTNNNIIHVYGGAGQGIKSVDPWDSNHHQLGCVETRNCTPKQFSIQWDWCKGKATVENSTKIMGEWPWFPRWCSWCTWNPSIEIYRLNWATHGVFTHYGRVYSKGKETGWFPTSNIEGCCRFCNQFGKCRSGLIGYFGRLMREKKKTFINLQFWRVCKVYTT